MALTRTFTGLVSEGDTRHADLYVLLHDLLDHLEEDFNEGEICDGVVALTSENPEQPLTGTALWEKLNEMYPYDGTPRFIDLLPAVQAKADQVKKTLAEIPHKPAIAEYLEAWRRIWGGQPASTPAT